MITRNDLLAIKNRRVDVIFKVIGKDSSTPNDYPYWQLPELWALADALVDALAERDAEIERLRGGERGLGKHPCRCPICNGTMIVPAGFYDQTSGDWSSCGGTEKCRNCNGTGVIFAFGPVDDKPIEGVLASPIVYAVIGGDGAILKHCGELSIHESREAAELQTEDKSRVKAYRLVEDKP